MNAFGDNLDEAPIAAIERKQEAAARVVDTQVDELVDNLIEAAKKWGAELHADDSLDESDAPPDVVDADAALQEYIAEIRAPGPRPCQCGAHLPHCPLYDEGTLPLAGPRELCPHCGRIGA